MSSKRYQQQDFRLIVGLRDGARGLQPAEVRTPIDGRTRITWLNESGGVGGSSLVDPDSEETTDGEGGGGGAGGNPDGTDDGSLEGLPDGIDADFVPDDVFDSVPGVNDLFSGIVSSNYGSGERFQAVDCETNECVEINTSGQFAPPTGWELADEGPLPEGYEAGFSGYAYFFSSIGYNGYGFTVDEAAKKIGDQYVLERSQSFFPEYDFSASGGTGVWVFYTRPNREPFTITGIAQRVDCATATGVSVQYCDGTIPLTPEQWPSDDCTQMVQGEDGRWTMHPKEPDRITKYEQGASLLSDICSGSRRFQNLPGINGGLVLWDYTNNIFRYKDPATGTISFGSSSGLKGVVNSVVNGITDANNQPFIKAVGHQD